MAMKPGMAWLILAVALTVNAQSRENAATDWKRSGGVAVRGQIFAEGLLVSSLTVELVTNGRSLSGSTYVAPDGSFAFSSVIPGGYELRITGAGGTVAYRENVVISGPEQNLLININGRRNVDTDGRGTISIRQLEHKIPPEARKEFNKGVAASKKGDHQGAVDHFQKAVSLDPELADGHNNLGSAYAALGQMEPAAEQFQKTIDLVPDHSLGLANLSVALCKLKRYAEAAQVARRALKLDSSLLKIRYVLAVSLIAQHGDNAEVLENLERATPEVPQARLVAADILAGAGRRGEAAKQLEQYLRSAPEQDADRQGAERRLAQLQGP
jgi:tetratricopeptide (TPR) repeat protein